MSARQKDRQTDISSKIVETNSLRLYYKAVRGCSTVETSFLQVRKLRFYKGHVSQRRPHHSRHPLPSASEITRFLADLPWYRKVLNENETPTSQETQVFIGQFLSFTLPAKVPKALLDFLG